MIEDGQDDDDWDIGFCPGCGADMAGEPPAEIRCIVCRAEVDDGD